MSAPITGLALKERTVRDYVRAAERSGARVDLGAIERLAVADCETFDAVTRAKRTPAPPAKPDPDKEAKRAAALDEEAASLGARVDHGDVTYENRPIPILNAKPLPQTRLACMLMRVQRILEGATPSSDMRAMVLTCDAPDLALEVLRLHAQIATRHRMPRPGDEANPFHGMSEIDCSRRYEAELINICDRSNARLGFGPWWVK